MSVKFKDFSYAYQGMHKVLNQINITIEAGSFTVITGPSGAGKTTLCLAIAGVVPHYCGGRLAGMVEVDGLNTVNISISDLAMHVGTVLEDYESQLVAMTVAEEVGFGLENRGLPESELEYRIDEVLKLVGLTGKKEWTVASLSGGQKQRLALAGMLAARPGILVLDEPAAALDPLASAEIYSLLGKLNRDYGITIVVVEHDLAKVLPYADQYVLLYKGEVMKTGKADAVFRYMWQDQAFRLYVPPLWQLKLTVEFLSGVQFESWQNESQAVAELKTYLLPEKKEACQGA